MMPRGATGSMTILVTGAAGFIGSHVATALMERGQAVLGIDNLNDYYDPRLKERRLEKLTERPGFEFLRLDFADKIALDEALLSRGDEIEYIIHLGAQAGVRHSIDHPY